MAYVLGHVAPGWGCIEACAAVGAAPPCIRNEADWLRLHSVARRGDAYIGAVGWSDHWMQLACDSNYSRWGESLYKEPKWGDRCLHIEENAWDGGSSEPNWRTMDCSCHRHCLCEVKPGWQADSVTLSALRSVQADTLEWQTRQLWILAGTAMQMGLEVEGM